MPRRFIHGCSILLQVIQSDCIVRASPDSYQETVRASADAYQEGRFKIFSTRRFFKHCVRRLLGIGSHGAKYARILDKGT